MTLHTETPVVLTHASSAAGDRAWKLCKCHRCGCVRQCAPGFDFYAKQAGDPLTCERCLSSVLAEPQHQKERAR